MPRTKNSVQKTARRDALALSVNARTLLQSANWFLRPPGGHGGKDLTIEDWSIIALRADYAKRDATRLENLALAMVDDLFRSKEGAR